MRDEESTAVLLLKSLHLYRLVRNISK